MRDGSHVRDRQQKRSPKGREMNGRDTGGDLFVDLVRTEDNL